MVKCKDWALSSRLKYYQTALNGTAFSLSSGLCQASHCFLRARRTQNSPSCLPSIQKCRWLAPCLFAYCSLTKLQPGLPYLTCKAAMVAGRTVELNSMKCSKTPSAHYQQEINFILKSKGSEQKNLCPQRASQGGKARKADSKAGACPQQRPLHSGAASIRYPFSGAMYPSPPSASMYMSRPSLPSPSSPLS